MGSDEAALREVARRQHWVFTFDQALSAHFTPRQIQLRAESGEWERIHTRVFRFPASARTPEQHAMGGVLACGAPCGASRRTGARVWGFKVPEPERPEVTVPFERNPTLRTVAVERSRHFNERLVGRLNGVPVLPPTQVITGLAALVDEPTLEIAIDDGVRRRLYTIERLDADARAPHVLTLAGTGTLRRLVCLRMRGRKIGSELETLTLRALRAAGLPKPEPQHPVRTRTGWRRIDFAYPEEMLAVEVDGYESHTDRAVFEDDRERRRELRRLGWEVVQLTWLLVLLRPIEVAMAVGEALGLAPVRWKRSRARGG